MDKISYEECVKKHITGPDLRFYKRSECPIPNSMYTRDIVQDYFVALHNMNIIKAVDVTKTMQLHLNKFLIRITHKEVV